MYLQSVRLSAFHTEYLHYIYDKFRMYLPPWHAALYLYLRAPALCVHLKQYLCHVRIIQFPYLLDDYHNSIILQQHPFEILQNRNDPVLDYSFVLDFSVNHFLIPLIVFPSACISPPIIISSFFNYSAPLYYVRFHLNDSLISMTSCVNMWIRWNYVKTYNWRCGSNGS